MRKALKTTLITIIVIAAGVALIKNTLIKMGAVNGLKKITGLRLEIQDIDAGIFNSRLKIKGVKVFNPEGPAEQLMFDMPLLDVRYELASFFKNKVHLYNLKLNLSQLNVDRGRDGKMNIMSLSALKPKNGGGKPPEIAIDLLELKIGKVSYKDHSTDPPTVKEFNLNVDERIQNVTDTRQLVNLILARALMNTDLSPIIGIFSDPEKAAKGQINALGRQAGEKLKEKTGNLLDQFVPKQ